MADHHLIEALAEEEAHEGPLWCPECRKVVSAIPCHRCKVAGSSPMCSVCHGSGSWKPELASDSDSGDECPDCGTDLELIPGFPFSEREMATVLAALRNWQIDALNEELGDEFSDFFADHAPLTDAEIDALCEAITFHHAQVPRETATATERDRERANRNARLISAQSGTYKAGE